MNQIYIKIFLISVLTFNSFQLFSQDVFMLTITVTNENGQPVGYAEILLKDSTGIVRDGGFTDENGVFKKQITKQLDNGTFEVKMLGYASYTRKIRRDEKIAKYNVRLMNETQELHEVVVQTHRSQPELSMMVLEDRVLSIAAKRRSRNKKKESQSASGFYIDGAGVPNAVAYTDEENSSVLTAGEIHDFSKWKLWQDMDTTYLFRFQDKWMMYPKYRYSVQLTNNLGGAVVDEEVNLVDKKGNVVWTARTDNTGKAELWYSMFSYSKKADKLFIEVPENAEQNEKTPAKPFNEGINMITMNRECSRPENADIAFVVDATSSMGDEIRYLRSDLLDIVSNMGELTPGVHVRTGAVFYKTKSDDYTTRVYQFTDDPNETADHVSREVADGGGVEVVEKALWDAVHGLKWSENARSRIVFLILDEPPGMTQNVLDTLANAIQDAAAMGIRVVPVVSSGTGYSTDKGLEYLMRSIALATNGTYVFLTDDSGIGGSHTAPTTDTYEKEKLNDIFRRLIKHYTFVPDCSNVNNTSAFTDTTFISSDSLHVHQDPAFADSAQVVSYPKNIPNPPYYDTATVIRDEWNVFPVPTRGPVNIQPPKFASAIYLTDLTGKVLLRAEPDNGLTLIKWDISGFSEGIYFIRAEGSEQMDTRRVILAH